jgi:hypothetical protein
VKIIEPETISDTVLAQADGSNVPEPDTATTPAEAVYVAGTIYHTGDQVIVLTTHKVYEALSQTSELMTLDVAPATAWAVGDLITGQTSAKTCVVVTVLTTKTFYVKDRTGAFTLDEIVGVTGVGGKLADQGAAHPTFSVVDNYPPTDVLLAVPKWMEVGATNRWKAFDAKIGSKTSQTTSVSYHLHVPVIDSLALLGLVGTSASIIVTDSTAVVVYNKTVDLLNNDAVIDWYTYFFEEIIYREDSVHTDLPAAYGSTLDIVVTNTGGTASIGEIVIGNVATIGTTRAEPKPSVSIKDYSTKDTDVFGNITIVERTYSKKLTCDLIITNTELDTVYNLFTTYRSTPVVWIASELYGSMILYGFYKEFDVVIPGPLMSECSLELEGLT